MAHPLLAVTALESIQSGGIPFPGDIPIKKPARSQPVFYVFSVSSTVLTVKNHCSAAGPVNREWTAYPFFDIT